MTGVRPVTWRFFLIALPCVAVVAAATIAKATGDAGASDASSVDSGAASVVGCNDPNVLGDLRLYVSGAEQSFVTYFGQQLASSATPITVVYQKTGSCVGIEAVAGTTTAETEMTGTAIYVDATGATHTCSFNPPSSAGAARFATVNIAVSDVYASSCGVALPANVEDTWGPISPAVFVTSPYSSQEAISAEIAYVAYGVNNGTSSPWDDPAYLLTRGAGSGTQVLAAFAINVPAGQWWGVNVTSTGNALIASSLSAEDGGTADKGLGVLSTAYVQTYVRQVKPLAFQAQGQIAAFYPGSTATSLDMRNVRDGHYVPWGQIHFFTQLVNGQPSAIANAIISRLTASVPDPSLISLAATQFAVPACAMSVRRTSELGPLEPFSPTVGCACYFEQQATGAAPSSCQSCETTSDCPTAKPACNYGYCEAQ